MTRAKHAKISPFSTPTPRAEGDYYHAKKLSSVTQSSYEYLYES